MCCQKRKERQLSAKTSVSSTIEKFMKRETKNTFGKINLRGAILDNKRRPKEFQSNVWNRGNIWHSPLTFLKIRNKFSKKFWKKYSALKVRSHKTWTYQRKWSFEFFFKKSGSFGEKYKILRRKTNKITSFYSERRHMDSTACV